MIRMISFKFASYAVTALLSGLLLFHILILTGLVPYGIVWGGSIENKSQMQASELFSIIVNLFMLFIVTAKASFIKISIPEKLTDLLLWAFVVFFALNTVGNLLSKSTLETVIFTPVSLLSAVFFLRLALEKGSYRL